MDNYIPLIIGGILGTVMGVLIMVLVHEISWRIKYSESMVLWIIKNYIKRR